MSVFPDGLFQYGGCPVGLDLFPALRKDAKVYFVDPASGSDSNSGLKPDNALDTVAAAYAKTVSGQGDIVILLGDGGTTGTARDSAITWANSNTHLVGVTAPAVNKRARIAPATTVTDVDAYTPYITLSGSGCVFANFSLFQGNSEDSKASIGIKVSGSRNYITNVDVITGAHANQGDEESYSIQVTGSENVVDSCYIGGDTWARGNNAVGCCVRFGSDASDQSTRNIFRDCVFTMFADDTEPTFIYAKTAFDTDRWNLFKRCTFINTGTSTIDAAVKWSDTTGKLFLQDCAFYGMTDITAADSSYVLMNSLASGTPVDAGHFKGVDVA